MRLLSYLRHIPAKIDSSLYLFVGAYLTSYFALFDFSSALFFNVMFLFMVAVSHLSVLLHESSHILTAKYFGYSTRKVTISMLGGVAEIETDFRNPSEEICIALAGPLCNFAIAAIFALGMPFCNSTEILPRIVGINILLGIFNLLPIFPMDGGRILRASLSCWYSADVATYHAARISCALSAGLFLLGLVSCNPIMVVISVMIFVYCFGLQKRHTNP